MPMGAVLPLQQTHHVIRRTKHEPINTVQTNESQPENDHI